MNYNQVFYICSHGSHRGIDFVVFYVRVSDACSGKAFGTEQKLSTSLGQMLVEVAADVTLEERLDSSRQLSQLVWPNELLRSLWPEVPRPTFASTIGVLPMPSAHGLNVRAGSVQGKRQIKAPGPPERHFGLHLGAPTRPKTPRRRPKRPQTRPKTPPKRPNILPRRGGRPQDGSRRLQDGLKAAQDGSRRPKTPPRRPKTSSRLPKTSPERPQTPRRRPKTPPGTSRRPQDGLKNGPHTPRRFAGTYAFYTGTG